MAIRTVHVQPEIGSWIINILRRLMGNVSSTENFDL